MKRFDDALAKGNAKKSAEAHAIESEAQADEKMARQLADLLRLTAATLRRAGVKSVFRAWSDLYFYRETGDVGRVYVARGQIWICGHIGNQGLPAEACEKIMFLLGSGELKSIAEASEFILPEGAFRVI